MARAGPDASVRTVDHSLASTCVIQWCAAHRSEHYYRMMACSAAVRTRIDTPSMRPTGRWPESLSGKRGEPFWLRPASCGGRSLVCGRTVADGRRRVATAAQHNGMLFGAPSTPIAHGAERAGLSVRAGQRQHLRALTLGKSTPDPIGLMHLQGMSPAGRHCRAFE